MVFIFFKIKLTDSLLQKKPCFYILVNRTRSRVSILSDYWFCALLMNLNLFSQWQPGPWVEFCRKKTKFRNLVPIISVYFHALFGGKKYSFCTCVARDRCHVRKSYREKTVAFAFPDHLKEMVQLWEKYSKVDAVRFVHRTCALVTF